MPNAVLLKKKERKSARNNGKRHCAGGKIARMKNELSQDTIHSRRSDQCRYKLRNSEGSPSSRGGHPKLILINKRRNRTGSAVAGVLQKKAERKNYWRRFDQREVETHRAGGSEPLGEGTRPRGGRKYISASRVA